MQTTRRKFIGLLAMAAAVLGLPKVAGALQQHSIPTIAQICAVSFNRVRDEMREGRDWVSKNLQMATDKGSIRIVPLGAIVELASTGRRYDISQMCVPVTWTHQDEFYNPTEEHRVALAGCLMENAILSAEDLLEQKLKHHDLAISKHYRVDKGETYQLENVRASYFLVYTAVAFLPKGSLAYASTHRS